MKKLLEKHILVVFILLVTAVSSFAKSGIDLLPYESETVFYLSINKQKLKELRKNKDIKKELKTITRLGIDLNKVKHMHGSVLSIKGRIAPDYIVVAEGSFNDSVIYAASKKHKVYSQSSHAGVSYLKSANKNDLSLVILSGRFFVLAKDKHLKKVIDLFQGKGKSVRHNRQMSTHLNAVSRANFVWVVVKITPQMKKEISENEKYYSSLKNVEFVTVSYVSSGEDIITINSICKYGRDVPEIKRFMKESIDMMALTLAMGFKDENTQNEVMKIGENAKYHTNGKTATVSIRINQKLIGILLKGLK